MSLFSAAREAVSLATVARAAGYLAILGLATFAYKLYHVRTKFRQLQKQGIDILPHSFLFGHIPVMAKLAIKHKMPPSAHGQIFPLLLVTEYPDIAGKGYIYMDTWPMAPPMISVFSPDMMAQFTQDTNMPKHPNMGREFAPFTDATDLACLENPEWKRTRSIFNPGFSAKNLLSLVPAFVEEALVFRKQLDQFAEDGHVVPIEKATTNLTVDIICRAVLGARVHAQKGSVVLMDSMLAQVRWLYFNLEPKKRFNPLVPFIHWYHRRRFRNALMPYITDVASNYEKLAGPKTILSLALKSYVEEVDPSARGNTLPSAFLENVVNHIKMFLFAGHDTTATTLAYIYYELSRNPDKAAKLREEHDSVLGRDPAAAADLITENPSLLNQLPYTLGVVKETLRLYPVVGTVRVGAEGFFLTHPETGTKLPTEGFMLFGVSRAVHRQAAYWPEPDSFVPERWTTRDESDPWHPVKNAFRPWELGPRNCIGQELASLELRLILALTVREFDILPAYPADAPTLLGEPAYQMQPPNAITAHPAGGLPATVKRRV